MKPDIDWHNPDPEYLRHLVERTGLSQRGVARRLGYPERKFRYHLTGDIECPYVVQFALEALAE